MSNEVIRVVRDQNITINDIKEYTTIIVNGGKLCINGNVPKFCKIVINAGELSISGDVGEHANISMNGGAFAISGGVGEHANISMNGGVFAISGDVGEHAKININGGCLTIVGDVRDNSKINRNGGVFTKNGRIFSAKQTGNGHNPGFFQGSENPIVADGYQIFVDRNATVATGNGIFVNGSNTSQVKHPDTGLPPSVNSINAHDNATILFINEPVETLNM